MLPRLGHQTRDSQRSECIKDVFIFVEDGSELLIEAGEADGGRSQ